MERSANTSLLTWKNSPNRKPLIINGARQVGKTWLVLEFGKQQFEQVAHVVFLENEQMQRAFAASINPTQLLTFIGAATGTNPLSGNTLVFFDEIQECPRAITALKLFYEQYPQIPIIAAGSLLGVALNRKQGHTDSLASWPVGKVEFLNLYPMTFFEFIAAAENKQTAQLLMSGDWALIDAMRETFSKLLKLYLFIGGMPEAVQCFVDTHDVNAVRNVQNNLLNSYELDFAKHAESAIDIERIRQTWKSLPLQLARESDMRRFTYAAIRSGARGRDYHDAVSWLIDAGLATRVPRITKPGIPLASYEDGRYFKLYLLDVGLLGAATGLSAKIILEGNTLFTHYKGVYAEQYVCQELVAAGITPKYWSADGKNLKGEVDFVIEHDGEVIPVEVKAEENVRGGSIALFAKRYNITRSVRLSMLPFKNQGWLVNIPLYATGILKQELLHSNVLA